MIVSRSIHVVSNDIILFTVTHFYGWVLFHSINIPHFLCVMSNSLWRHGLQHARPPHPSPTPGACSNSCPLSQWCYPTISSSVVPFSSCLQCFPASGSFPMNQFFASGGQSIGASTSASVLPVNIQDWFPWTSWGNQLGLPMWLTWYRIHLHCKRPVFDPWVGKIPWRRERLPTLVFWPREFHGLCIYIPI